MFTIVRLIQSLLIYAKYRFKVSSVVEETPTVLSIYISGHQVSRFGYRPGQYIMARFLKGSTLRHERAYAVSLPSGNDKLRVTIRSFNKRTSEFRRLKPGTPVLLTGPFGGYPFPVAQKVLLLGSGVGIAPLRVMAEDWSREKDILLLNFATSSKRFALESELESLGIATKYLVQENLEITPNLLLGLVPDIKEREVYVCGAPDLIKQATKSLFGANVPKHAIHY